ncbi:hypothetical protein FOZ62_008019 [Perkinsus olseni]|uniref:Uncharacterized protein n=2 Tax=Perkinsus olseni TaxID=32597 RepID=A0A7J6SWU2_PEROL|nr:hypothetical protein FOZ62_008019 [Perkinsus olseni]
MEEELLESEQRYGSRPRKSEPEVVEQTRDRSQGAVMRSEAPPSVSRADSLKERLEKKLGLERRIEYELAKALSEVDLRSELHQERERRRQARRSRLMGHRRDERIAEAQKRKTAGAMRFQDELNQLVRDREEKIANRLETLRTEKISKVQQIRQKNEARRDCQLERVNAIHDMKRMVDAMASAKRAGDLDRARRAAGEAADEAWKRLADSRRSRQSALISRRGYSRASLAVPVHAERRVTEVPGEGRENAGARGQQHEVVSEESASRFDPIQEAFEEELKRYLTGIRLNAS